MIIRHALRATVDAAIKATGLLLRRLGYNQHLAQQHRLPSELVVRRSSRRTPRDPPSAHERFVAAP